MRFLSLCFLFFFCVNVFSQHDTLDPAVQKKMKSVQKELKGSWWLLRMKYKSGSKVLTQETNLQSKEKCDSLRPLMRMDIQKKGLTTVIEFPYMKARVSEIGLFTVLIEITGSMNTDNVYLNFSDNLRKLLGAKGRIQYKFTGKNLILTDESGSVFEWKPD